MNNEPVNPKYVADLEKIIVRLQVEIEALKAKTPTEDEVSKYWYNKGHEDGRKLAVVNTLTEARILKVIKKTHFADGYLNANLIKFAEAILKEASEK